MVPVYLFCMLAYVLILILFDKLKTNGTRIETPEMKGFSALLLYLAAYVCCTFGGHFVNVLYISISAHVELMRETEKVLYEG